MVVEHQGNYLKYIINFWQKDTEHNFLTLEVALYFFILKTANGHRWKNPFGLSNALTIAKFGIGKTAFDTAKRNLKQAGLIDFKPGDGRGNVYQYYLKPVVEVISDNEETKVSQKHTLSSTLSDTLSSTLSELKPATSINNKEKHKTKKESNEISFPPAPKIKKEKIFQIIFRDSEIFNKEKFQQDLVGTQYEDANIDHYHEIILNWSDSKNSKKVNWLATAKNWMARDITDGKFIKKNNGNSKTSATANGTKKSTGGSIEELQALKQRYAAESQQNTEPAGDAGNYEREEWAEAVVV
jgi:hypothetical protein